MPHSRRNAINELFRERPGLAIEILRDLMDVDVPLDEAVCLDSNDFNGCLSRDFEPAAVIIIGSPGEPVHGIVVEVQQEKIDDNRRQLPRYAASLWLMLRCSVTVLCICTDRDAAAWYAEPIDTELPGYVFRAAVLGPCEVPVITDRDVAAKQPELALLGVMIHGRNRQVLKAFVGAELSRGDRSLRYYRHACDMAAPKIRSMLEEVMASEPWPIQSPYLDKFYGRGRDDGRVEGRADAVLKVLAVREIEVPEDVRTRISTCTDTRQLDTWLDRAVTAASADDLFE